MRHWLRSHLTYANVMVTILAFLVLGGSSAVALSGNNNIFTDDIVNDEVYSLDVRDDTLPSGGLRAVDLRPNAVGTSEVANASLTGSDILNGSLGTADIGTIPAARATATSNQSIPNNTATTISLDSEVGSPGAAGFDTASLHDNAVNNSRLTAPVTGTYLVSAELRWQLNSTGYRAIQIVSSADSVIATTADEPVASTVIDRDQSVSGVARLTAGDYVELNVAQNSGSALNSLAGGANLPYLGMVWLGP